MKLETQKDKIGVNKMVGQKTENVFVEGDTIIPDVKPDIINSIYTNGTVCIYKKELLEGRVRIDGSINSYVMYLSDGENESIRSLNTSLDFTQVFDLDLVTAGMDLEVEVNLKSMECKVLNGRKVNIKACLEFKMKVYSNETIEVVKNISNVQGVQTLNRNLKINSLVGRR